MDFINAAEVYEGINPLIYAKVNGRVCLLPKRGTWYGRKIRIVVRMLKELDFNYTQWNGRFGTYELTPKEIARLPANVLPDVEEIKE